MDLLYMLPGVALSVGLAAPALRRQVTRHTTVVSAQRALEHSRLVGAHSR